MKRIHISFVLLLVWVCIICSSGLLLAQEDCCPEEFYLPYTDREEPDLIKRINGNIYVVSYSFVPSLLGADKHALLTKMDEDLTVIWRVVFRSSYSTFTDIAGTADGGVLIIGKSPIGIIGSQNQMYSIRVSSTGETDYGYTQSGSGFSSFNALATVSNSPSPSHPYATFFQESTGSAMLGYANEVGQLFDRKISLSGIDVIWEGLAATSTGEMLLFGRRENYPTPVAKLLKVGPLRVDAASLAQLRIPDFELVAVRDLPGRNYYLGYGNRLTSAANAGPTLLLIAKSMVNVRAVYLSVGDGPNCGAGATAMTVDGDNVYLAATGCDGADATVTRYELPGVLNQFDDNLDLIQWSLAGSVTTTKSSLIAGIEEGTLVYTDNRKRDGADDSRRISMTVIPTEAQGDSCITVRERTGTAYSIANITVNLGNLPVINNLLDQAQRTTTLLPLPGLLVDGCLPIASVCGESVPTVAASTVVLQRENCQGNLAVQVRNASGQMVSFFTLEETDPTIEFSIEGFPSGTYTVYIYGSFGSKTRTVLIA